jgi:hypothetical protein
MATQYTAALARHLAVTTKQLTDLAEERRKTRAKRAAKRTVRRKPR